MQCFWLPLLCCSYLPIATELHWKHAKLQLLIQTLTKSSMHVLFNLEGNKALSSKRQLCYSQLFNNSMYLIDQFLYFRHHVPVIFYLLFHVHNLFIVINSSVNVIVYYCVGKEFRKEAKSLWKHVKEKLCCRSNTWIYIPSIYDNVLWNIVPCLWAIWVCV